MRTAAALLEEAAPGLDELERRASDVRWGGRDEVGAMWASLVLAEHVIAAAATLDASTGLPLAVPLAQALASIREATEGKRWPLPRDGLARVIELTLGSLERILASPRWRPQRVRVRMQPEKIRQQDVKCLTWLARQPGVTLHEKSASARQVLGVIRQRNHDTPENRLVRRVLVWLDRLIRQRLEACRGEFDVMAPGLLQALQRMRQLVRWELESSPMADVVPGVRLEPNNVLLGDPDYSRAWRAFRWLSSREAHAERAWQQRNTRLTAAVGAVVLATIAGRKDVILENGLTAIDLDGVTEGDFGLLAAKVTLLAAPRADHVCVLRVEREPTGWRIEQRFLVGSSLLEEARPRSLWLAATFSGASGSVAGRGQPARLTVRAGQEEESFEFFADTEGLRDTGRMLAEQWLGPEAAAPTFLLLPSEGAARKAAARYVGWDISSPVLMAAGGPELDPRRGLTLVGREPPRSARWFVGKDGLALSSDASSLSGPKVLARVSGEGQEPLSPAVSRALLLALFRSAMEDGAGPEAGGALALVVPDDTDEAGAGLLREALPANQSGALFVPSSVAAVLEWRRRQGSAPVAEPRPVLVLNAQAPRLTATHLEFLRDEEATRASDPFVWRRSHPFEPLAEAQEVSAAAWELALAKEAAMRASGGALEEPLLHDVATRLVDGGLLADLLEDSTARAVLVPIENGAGRWLRVERYHIDPSAVWPVWLGAFQRWCDAFERNAGERLRAQVKGRPLTILVVGTPFEQASLQEEIRSVLGRRFAANRVEVIAGGAKALAQGARESLERRARKEPTWSDLLPPLLLEVRTKKGSEWIELIKANHTVRPGDRVEVSVERRLELPRGKQRVDFPLSRDRRSDRAAAGFIAMLEHESFPLKQEVKVRLRVDFRYAEDAFRVHVIPVEPAPFAALEFRWEAGAPDARQEILNDPPSAPEELPWDESAPEVDRFIKAVEKLRPLSKKTFTGNLVADVKEKSRHKKFLENLATVEPLVSADALGIKGLWSSARKPGPPGRVATALQTLWCLLAEFGGLPMESSKKSRGCEPLTKPSLWEAPQVRKELGELRLKALSTLGALRADAPPQLLGKLLARARADARSQPILEAMGRQLTSPDRPAVREALDWLVARLELDERLRPQDLKLPLWALATGFWSTPSAVFELQEQTVSRLANVCEVLVGRIAAEWHAERVGANLFEEVLAVLYGLLRRRPQVEEPRLRAGTPEATHLARAIEGAAAALAQTGRPVRPRLRLNQEQSLSEVVSNALRGQSLALVTAFED